MTRHTYARLLALPALLCLALPALALDDWNILETESFTLLSNLDEGTTRTILQDLEQLRAVLSQLFPEAELDAAKPTLFYLFRDDSSYAPYSLGGSGFFVPHIHANFAAIVADQADTARPLVYRQYLAELVNHNVPRAPLWLRYGLAELFSTLEVSGSSAVVGIRPEEEAALTGQGPMPIAAVLGASQVPAGPDAVGFRNRSWELTHYLLVENTARRQEVLAWTNALEKEEPSAEGLLKALGVDADKLEQDLHAYLLQEDLPSRTVALKPGGEDGARYLPLSPSNVLLSLADLLLHTQPDKTAQAKALLDEALHLDPDHGPARAGLGYIKELEGDLQAARDLYIQALEKIPAQELEGARDGFRLYFYLGDVELKLLGQKRPANTEERNQLDKASEMFERCTQLRPTYGEAWARLGYVYTLEEKPSSNAIPTLEKAYELLPERADVGYNLFLAYARKGRRDDAAVVLDKLQHRGADEETLKRAQETLLQLDFRAATELLRQKNVKEAASILERIKAESSDPGLQKRASDLLSQITPGSN